MTEIEVGDVVLARGASGPYYAVVRGVRLNRLVVERCDGRAGGPVALREVASVFKEAGAPDGDPSGARLRPSAQLRLDLQ